MHCNAHDYRGKEYQGEVGLLSRTLTVQGTAESDAAGKGPHIHIQGKARLTGTMVHRMGQTNVSTAFSHCKLCVELFVSVIRCDIDASETFFPYERPSL
jgi:hypothetical protein